MDRAIDTTPAEQRRVCCVNNGGNLDFRNVAAKDFDSIVGILHESLR
jgi:hypothetical protein